MSLGILMNGPQPMLMGCAQVARYWRQWEFPVVVSFDKEGSAATSEGLRKEGLGPR